VLGAVAAVPALKPVLGALSGKKPAEESAGAAS